jgi:hypothetical protein
VPATFKRRTVQKMDATGANSPRLHGASMARSQQLTFAGGDNRCDSDPMTVDTREPVTVWAAETSGLSPRRPMGRPPSTEPASSPRPLRARAQGDASTVWRCPLKVMIVDVTEVTYSASEAEVTFARIA